MWSFPGGFLFGRLQLRFFVGEDPVPAHRQHGRPRVRAGLSCRLGKTSDCGHWGRL
jgi:hypothetical protein